MKRELVGKARAIEVLGDDRGVARHGLGLDPGREGELSAEVEQGRIGHGQDLTGKLDGLPGDASGACGRAAKGGMVQAG